MRAGWLAICGLCFAGPWLGCSTGLGRCGEDILCGACPAPLALEVVDAHSGEPLTGHTVECSVRTVEGLKRGHCNAGAGRYEVTISAPGYGSTELSVQVPYVADTNTCCPCTHRPVSKRVELSRQ